MKSTTSSAKRAISLFLIGTTLFLAACSVGPEITRGIHAEDAPNMRAVIELTRGV